MPSSNQTCVNHLGKHGRAAKQDAKPAKCIPPTQIAKSASRAIIKLRCNTSCKTTKVVYLIISTKCRKQYIGETGDHVNQQRNGHRDDWKHKRFERSPVAEHFCSPEHDFLNHAALCCLNHNPEWTDRTKKTRERQRERESALLDPTTEHSMVSIRATGGGNQSSLVRACESLWEMFCSCDFPESLRKLGPFTLRIGEKHSVWRISLSV